MSDTLSIRKIPQEVLPDTNWRRITTLLGLILAVLFFANIFAYLYLDSYSVNYGYWTIHQKWNLLGKLSKPVDWLILGDSSCSQGVMPEVFTTELNQTAINLCTTGDMGTLDNLWLIEEYIQRFGPPQNILVVHTFDIWHRQFNPVRLGQVPRPWRFWEAHTNGSELMEEVDTRNGIFIDHYLPLYSQNNSIGMIIRGIFSGEHKPFVSKWAMDKDGFVPAYESKPEVVKAGEQQQIQFATENVFKVSYLNDESLRKMMRLAEENQINLYLANAPAFEGLYSNPAYQAYFQDLQTYLAGIANESGNGYHIPAVMTFPVDQMQNPDHLIVSGAEEFTHWLIEEIQKISE